MSDQPVEKKPRKWKKLKIALLVVVVLAVLVGVRWQVGLWMARGAWEDALEKLREHGHPTSFAELEALREDVWAEENAARVIEDFEKNHNSFRWGKRVMFFETEKRRTAGSYFFAGIEPDALAESKAFYEQNKDVADRLSELKGKPTGRSKYSYNFSSDVDLNEVIFPSWYSYRDATRFLCLQTALQLEEGEREKAVESCVQLFHVAGALDNEMAMISHFVQSAILSLGVRSVEDILRTGELTAGQIDLLEKTMTTRFERFDPTNGLRFEVLGITSVCEFEVQEGFSCIDFSLLGQKGVEAFFNKAAEWQPEETLRESQVVIVDWMLPVLDAASKKDWHAFREAALALESEPGRNYVSFDIKLLNVKGPTRFSPFDQYRIPNRHLISMEQFVKGFQKMQSELLCALTALEVERFRMAHGRFPETLDELVPEYLDAVPVDPMDDQPLRYLHTDYGVVVYCVGMNGVDDGGAVESSLDEKGNVKRSLDRGFRLLVPERRGVVYDDGSRDEVSSNGG